MDSKTLYVCNNIPECSLGPRGEPGHFTDGLTESGARAMGLPLDAPTGEGICPNCGAQGEPTGDTHESAEGDDPNQDLHDQVQARVDDSDDPLDADGAQEALMDLIGDPVEDSPEEDPS